MSIDICTSLGIFIICLISIFTDFKYGIIKNVYLLFWGIIVIGLNVISIALNESIVWWEYFVTVSASVLLSLCLFFLKIWAGGDSKLYIVLILAMPYKFTVIKFFGLNSIVLIPVFAFLCGYIYILVETCVRKIRSVCDKRKKRVEKEGQSIIKKSIVGFVQYLKYFFALVFVNRILNIAFNALSINFNNQWITLIINVVIVWAIGKLDVLTYKSVVIVLVLVDVIMGVVNLEWIFNQYTILTWIAILVSNMLKNFSAMYNYDTIDIVNVEPGMILSTASSFYLSTDKKCGFNKISDETLKSRLTQEDVEAINEFSNRNKQITEINIVRKIPFALFIAIATILVLVWGVLL